MNRGRLLAVVLMFGLIAGGAVWLVGPPPRARREGAMFRPTVFSHDSRWLVIAEEDRKGDRGRWLVLDAGSGDVRLEFPGRRVHSWAFSPDGRLLARAADYTDALNGIDVWDLHTGLEVKALSWRALPGFLNVNLPAGTLTFAADGRLLLYSCSFGIWDVAARKRIADLGPLAEAMALPNRQYSDLLAYHREREWVRLWSVKAGGVVSTFPLPGSMRNYVWSPNGRFLALDFYNLSSIAVLHGRDGTMYPVIPGDGLVTSIADDGPVLAVAADPAINEWLQRRLSRWLAPSDRRRPVVRLYDVPTGRQTDEVPGRWPLLSPNGRTLAVQGEDGALELWDLPRPGGWLRTLGAGLTAAGTILLGATARARWRRRRPVIPRG